ncbi:hypothetical protein [Salana multivorans]|nr:hypothetical protein [Salana multivorans]
MQHGYQQIAVGNPSPAQVVLPVLPCERDDHAPPGATDDDG